MSRRPDDRGQVVVLFAVGMVALFAIAALLFTGGVALVLRRDLQDSGDAAALAAANLVPSGGACSTARVTAPSGDLYAAAKASVQANTGWTDAQVASRMSVACPSDPSNTYHGSAVQVDLTAPSDGIFGASGLAIATTSVAINGQVSAGDYSIALLDPSHVTWPAARRGCPSLLLSGSTTVTFGGGVMVNSTCTAADGSSLKAVDSGSSITLVNGAVLRTAGEYYPGSEVHINPDPLQNQRPLLRDPLAGLIPPCTPTETVNCLGSATTLPAADLKTSGSGGCKNQDPCVLSPGTYGSFKVGSGSYPSTVLLRPGVYVIKGGASFNSSAARMYAIPPATGTCGGAACTDTAVRKLYDPGSSGTLCKSLTATDCTTKLAQQWRTDCPEPTPASPMSKCGVVLYIAPSTTSWNTNGDALTVGSQGVMELRGYNPSLDAANGTRFASYKNLVVWQARTPAPTGNGQTQPVIGLNGGGCITLTGTVYAPGAKVDMTGASCGTGGSDSAYDLQFIVWDLNLGGGSTFTFAYQRDYFAVPAGYGLIR